MKVPTLLMADKVLKMDTSSKTADLILKFSNDRRNLGVDKFISRHIEIIAEVFKVSTEEIRQEVDFTVIVGKYLDCLEYTARRIGELNK